MQIYKKVSRFITILTMGTYFLSPLFVSANTIAFNPQYIISDEEMQSTANWTTADIQKFLQDRGSYLATLTTPDYNGQIKPASQIIQEASQQYQINPKYLLVTLQKEQSLVTDDTPTQKQLDWATGYGVCDSCSMDDPKVIKFKGFGKQVDNAAGIIRWYYNNSSQSFVKKKDQNITIDNTPIVPQSWATAFLYTYTPHLHGNQNFWRIWNTWFSQMYPNGTLLRSETSDEVWLIQNNVKRKFKNQATLLSRADPKMIVTVPESELSNYQLGTDIVFPNYSILKSQNNFYLLDYDTLRPFASADVVSKLGYNPEEYIDITDSDIVGYPIGTAITASTTAPFGVIYQITDLNNSYYLFKDNILSPITDKSIIAINYKDLKIEKHKAAEIKKFDVADLPINFKDGTLLRANSSNKIYVIENSKKRLIADVDTFAALGYKRENVVLVNPTTILNILSGEPLFINGSLVSSRNKYLGDSEVQVDDLFGTTLPGYLVAEYPSGRIISGKNIDKARPIASMVKLLVAYEALNQDFDLTQSSIYSSTKHKASGRNLALQNGAKIKNADLLSAMLVGSTNNAARMIAQNSGLTEKDFIGSIKTRLENWGADDTSIIDVTGMDVKNKSTPRNLLKVSTKILENSAMKTALAKDKYTFKVGTVNQSVTTPGTGSLVAYKTYKILASKTGSTDEAGVVTMELIQTTSKPTKQYIIITMGGKDLKNQEANKMAKWIASGTVKITNK
jgi:D-alanyl-D-alanine endopeptidase (penicillin-binding protein 7)